MLSLFRNGTYVDAYITNFCISMLSLFPSLSVPDHCWCTGEGGKNVVPHQYSLWSVGRVYSMTQSVLYKGQTFQSLIVLW